MDKKITKNKKEKKGLPAGDLLEAVKKERLILRDLRFGSSGSRNANVKAICRSRRQIARLLTNLNQSKQTAI